MEEMGTVIKTSPDETFVTHNITVTRQEFCIEFNREGRLKKPTSNLSSQNFNTIGHSENLATEVTLNIMVKLPVRIWPSGTYVSLLGVIPK